MDTFELIGWLIVLFFFLFGRSRKKSKPLPPAGEGAGAEPSQAPVTFEDALREIREALGEASQKQGRQPEKQARQPEVVVASPRPAQPPVPPRPDPVAPRRQPRPERAREKPVPPRTVRRDAEFKPALERAAGGRQTIARRERAFTSRPEFAGDEFLNLEQATVRGKEHPHRQPLSTLRAVSKRPAPGPPRPSSLLPGKLGDKTLRQGILLSEILGPPRALRPYSPHHRRDH